MPHTCIGAIQFHYHGIVDFLTSDNAIKVVEAAAAGSAVYQALWSPIRKFAAPMIAILLALISITKVQTEAVATFAHRMKPCYPLAAPNAPRQPAKQVWQSRDGEDGSAQAAK